MLLHYLTFALRARETILSHFRIPSSSHLEPICLKSGREFLEIIISQVLK